MQLRQIGVIHSPFRELQNTPKRPGESKEEAIVEVYPEYAEGLKDLDGFSHIFVICYLDRIDSYSNFAYPPQDGEKRGVFATRSPFRPNPISLSRVKVKKIQDNQIIVEGLDMLDKTPLIDIKPYTERTPEDASFGWVEQYMED